MLEFLAAQKDSFVVIIDEISRFARDLSVHTQLMAKVQAHKAKLESPQIEFGESPHEKLVENMLASVAAYQRDANKEQVGNKMKARLENGFWPFRAPIGYRFISKQGSGKILVKDFPLAHLIAEAFEGFATGRFEDQMDVANFMKNDIRLINKKVANIQRIKGILAKPLYAGCIEFEDWNVEFRKGRHEPIVSLATYEKVQQRLSNKAKAPNRKDVHKDFPLRGFVLCAYCKKPMTAHWARGGS